MDVKTTTYPARNVALLKAAADSMRQRPIAIVEVGPGMVLKGLGTRFRPRQFLWPAVKVLETLLRRVPFPDSWYDSYETSEILGVFDPGGSDRVTVTVVDINPKPLRVIRRKLGAAAVACRNLDIAGNEIGADLKGAFDVAIAFAAIERVPVNRQGLAAGNLVGMLKVGGLLATSATQLIDAGGYEMESIGTNGLYRKTG